eukprot:5168674-Prymnesium_polylepis.1
MQEVKCIRRTVWEISVSAFLSTWPSSSTSSRQRVFCTRHKRSDAAFAISYVVTTTSYEPACRRARTPARLASVGHGCSQSRAKGQGRESVCVRARSRLVRNPRLEPLTLGGVGRVELDHAQRRAPSGQLGAPRGQHRERAHDEAGAFELQAVLEVRDHGDGLQRLPPERDANNAINGLQVQEAAGVSLREGTLPRPISSPRMGDNPSRSMQSTIQSSPAS